MSLIICNQHGKTGAVLVFPKLVECIQTDTPISGKLIKIGLKWFDVTSWYWIDDKSIADYVPDENCERIFIDDEDKVEKILSALKPICGKCYRDYAGRFGLKDPADA